MSESRQNRFGENNRNQSQRNNNLSQSSNAAGREAGSVGNQPSNERPGQNRSHSRNRGKNFNNRNNQSQEQRGERTHQGTESFSANSPNVLQNQSLNQASASGGQKGQRYEKEQSDNRCGQSTENVQQQAQNQQFTSGSGGRFERGGQQQNKKMQKGPKQQEYQPMQHQQQKGTLQEQRNVPTSEQGAQSAPTSATGPPPPRNPPKSQGSVNPKAAKPKGDTSQKNVDTVSEKMADLNLTVSMLKKTKPSSGTRGKQISLFTNYVPIDFRNLPNSAIHYDCSFTPEKPKRMIPLAMQQFLKQECPGKFPAFDGKKNLFSASELFKGLEKVATVSVIEDEYMNDFRLGLLSNEDLKHKTVTFDVKVQKVNTIDFQYLKRMDFSSDNSMERKELVLQCIDVVLRSATSVNLLSLGRNFYPKGQQGRTYLGQGLDLWQGVFQSAVLGTKLFLNVDVTNKGVTSDRTFLELFEEYTNEKVNNVRDLNRYTYIFKDIAKTFRTMKILFQIPKMPTSKRKYSLNDFVLSAETQAFEVDGKKITVQEYFRKVKNYQLKFPKFPCLWVGDRTRHIYLPYELCSLVPGQATNKKYSDIQTRKMIQEAATSTDVRKNKILNNLNSINFNAQSCLQEFKIGVGNQFERINARILPPPKLHYEQQSSEPRKGCWRSSSFIKSCEIVDWTILAYRVHVNQGMIKSLEDNVMRSCRNCGITIARPKDYKAINSSNEYDLVNYFKAHGSYQLIIVILDDRDKSSYGLIKRIAEIDIGVVTQCLKFSTVTRKMNESTMTNILLKVNAKMNGVNYKIDRNSSLLRSEDTCLFMGADVTHPPPDAQDELSVAAVTASIDEGGFSYNIQTRLQEPKQEIIEDLYTITRQHLFYFYTLTGKKPSSVYYFRDGCSDGQFAKVLVSELSEMKRAFRSLGNGSYSPRVTFLVVQKRHHTRFFPENIKICEDRNNNLPAGTCVDSTIVHPDEYDFYLLSHGSIQGVSKPTRYRMLYDENGHTDDTIEQLTFNLCHMYSRCTRSVSYPAPTYYAHLAAFRAKNHLTSSNFDNKRTDINQKMEKLKLDNRIQKSYPMFFV